MNVHKIIGWFNCANLACQRPLNHDHYVLTSTTQMRRFCSPWCIEPGHKLSNHLGQLALASADIDDINDPALIEDYLKKHQSAEFWQAQLTWLQESQSSVIST